MLLPSTATIRWGKSSGIACTGAGVWTTFCGVYIADEEVPGDLLDCRFLRPVGVGVVGGDRFLLSARAQASGSASVGTSVSLLLSVILFIKWPSVNLSISIKLY